MAPQPPLILALNESLSQIIYLGMPNHFSVWEGPLPNYTKLCPPTKSPPTLE